MLKYICILNGEHKSNKRSADVVKAHGEYVNLSFQVINAGGPITELSHNGKKSAMHETKDWCEIDVDGYWQH